MLKVVLIILKILYDGLLLLQCFHVVDLMPVLVKDEHVFLAAVFLLLQLYMCTKVILTLKF